MELGDLVKLIKYEKIGIVVEVFGDLDPNNPWIRVLFTGPHNPYQWCKKEGLLLLSKKREEDDHSL
tara:strand:+ start:674 stop:871 length:198 start_codon:yes stop_codon:yes gene_type:complete